ncbi:hypothetical protein BDZ97DRAFT_1751502 [Flammula alnicola]|nr:hypothetical protein BDZ97DRAFT_1751502 [Flammula alnicola]
MSTKRSMADDTENGKPTWSGRIPVIKCKAVKAIKSLILKNTDKNVAVTSAQSNPAPKKTPQDPSHQLTVIDITDENDESSKSDGKSESSVEEQEEIKEAELNQLKVDWNTPIYAFFHTNPIISYEK